MFPLAWRQAPAAKTKPGGLGAKAGGFGGFGAAKPANTSVPDGTKADQPRLPGFKLGEKPVDKTFVKCAKAVAKRLRLHVASCADLLYVTHVHFKETGQALPKAEPEWVRPASIAQNGCTHVGVPASWTLPACPLPNPSALRSQVETVTREYFLMRQSALRLLVAIFRNGSEQEQGAEDTHSVAHTLTKLLLDCKLSAGGDEFFQGSSLVQSLLNYFGHSECEVVIDPKPGAAADQERFEWCKSDHTSDASANKYTRNLEMLQGALDSPGADSPDDETYLHVLTEARWVATVLFYAARFSQKSHNQNHVIQHGLSIEQSLQLVGIVDYCAKVKYTVEGVIQASPYDVYLEPRSDRFVRSLNPDWQLDEFRHSSLRRAEHPRPPEEPQSDWLQARPVRVSSRVPACAGLALLTPQVNRGRCIAAARAL